MVRVENDNFLGFSVSLDVSVCLSLSINPSVGLDLGNASFDRSHIAFIFAKAGTVYIPS
jgi:hypothetical protein